MPTSCTFAHLLIGRIIQSALDEFAEMEAATAYGLEHLNDVVLEEETE